MTKFVPEGIRRMADRATALCNICVGDIFHATAPNEASLICLTLSVTQTTIYARTVTSQFQFEFDRTTGEVEWEFHGYKIPCIIDSVASLPAHVRELMLELDHKNSSEAEEEDGKLTEDERRALVFVARYYPAHPITPPPSAWQMMSVDRKFVSEGDPKDYDSLTGDEKTALILVNYLIPANRS